MMVKSSIHAIKKLLQCLALSVPLEDNDSEEYEDIEDRQQFRKEECIVPQAVDDHLQQQNNWYR
jgi:hypothetical protein